MSGSRYHQLPRDSIDSERDDAHEYLIPSPQSGAVADQDIYNIPGHNASNTRDCSINPKIFHRIFSSACCLTGFLFMILSSPNTMIPSAVFMMLTLTFNVYMLIYMAATQFVSFSIFYGERDILAIGKDTFRRPNLSSYFDLLAAVSIFIPLTIAMVENRHWGSPIASAVLGYTVIVVQVIIAWPTAGNNLRFSVRKVRVVMNTKKPSQRTASKAGEKNNTMMAGAVSNDAVGPSESSAIPAPLVVMEPTAEVSTDLV